MQHEKTYPITLAQIKAMANMASAIDYAKSHAHIAGLSGLPELKTDEEIQRDIQNFVGVQHRILEKILGEDAGLVYSEADGVLSKEAAAHLFCAVADAAQQAAA